MGEVVAFRMASASRRGATSGEEAQIILFTGVRYVRIDAVEPPQDAGDAPTRAANRRRRGKRRA